MTGAEVTITGNLTADPEMRYTQNGRPVASFTVAHTARRLNRQTNEWEDNGEPLFLRCSAWGELGENIAASLTKGDAVMLIGRLVSRTFDTAEGQRRTVIECQAEVVAVDLRRQTVATVLRIRKGGAPADPAPDVWTPAAVATAAA